MHPPRTHGLPILLFFFLLYPNLYIYIVGSCPFSPLGFVAQGAPEPGERFENALAQGGHRRRTSFPIHRSGGCLRKITHRPPPTPLCVDRETPLCRGRDCPPTALFLGHWCFVDRGSAAKPWEGLPPHRIAPHWRFCRRHVFGHVGNFSGLGSARAGGTWTEGLLN